MVYVDKVGDDGVTDKGDVDNGEAVFYHDDGGHDYEDSYADGVGLFDGGGRCGGAAESEYECDWHGQGYGDADDGAGDGDGEGNDGGGEVAGMCFCKCRF